MLRHLHLTCALLALLALASVSLPISSGSMAGECVELQTGEEKCEARSFPVLLQKSKDQAKVAMNPAEGAGAGLGSSDCSCRTTVKTWHSPPSAKTGSGATELAPCFVEVPPEAWKSSSDGLEFDTLSDDVGNGTDGNGTDVNMIYLLGDSHAGALKPAVEKVINEQPFKVFHGGRCLYAPWPASFKVNQELVKAGNTKECEEINNRLDKHLSQHVKPGDLVFVSNHFAPYAPGYLAGPEQKLSFEEELERYKDHLVKLHTMVAGQGGKIVLFGTNTLLNEDGSSCIPTYWDPDAPRKCEMNKTDYKAKHGAYMDPIMDMYADLARTKSGIAVFDMEPLFCDDKTCGAFIPGTTTLAIWDLNHLTLAGSEYLAPYLCSFLSSNGMVSKTK